MDNDIDPIILRLIAYLELTVYFDLESRSWHTSAPSSEAFIRVRKSEDGYNATAYSAVSGYGLSSGGVHYGPFRNVPDAMRFVQNVAWNPGDIFKKEAKKDWWHHGF